MIMSQTAMRTSRYQASNCKQLRFCGAASRLMIPSLMTHLARQQKMLSEARTDAVDSVMMKTLARIGILWLQEINESEKKPIIQGMKPTLETGSKSLDCNVFAFPETVIGRLLRKLSPSF